jgi:hypothetical protein
MSETPLHGDLVAALLSYLAGTEGAVMHVVGHPGYPDPPRIGRYKPDLYLVSPDGRSIIGEAKTGPDLSEDVSREQLADFSTHRDDDGEHAAFWLCVPKGWKAQALAAIGEAGGETHRKGDVLELNIPGLASPSSS